MGGRMIIHTFPKVPRLLQYVSNGNYYARIKANGKIIRGGQANRLNQHETEAGRSSYA